MERKIKSLATVFASTLLTIAFVALPFQTVYAQEISQDDLNKYLNSIYSVLINISKDLQSGQVSVENAKTELERLSVVINAFLSIAESNLLNKQGFVFEYDSPPGQVLGAFTESPAQPKHSTPEAFIAIMPVGSSGSNVIIKEDRLGTVLRFRIKSFYSDIEVRRVDVVFDQKMWMYAEEISLVSSGKTISKIVQPMSPWSFFDTGSGKYAVRFTDFSESVPKDKTKTFYIRVKVREFIPDGINIKVFLDNKSVRAIDESGFQHLVPGSSGGIGGSFSREFRVEKD